MRNNHNTSRIASSVPRRSQRSRACRRGKTKASGAAFILALIMLALLATMSLAFASQTGMNLAASDNYRNANNAQLAAESGLDFMLSRLRVIRLRTGTDANAMAAALAQELGRYLNGTSNLGARQVTVAGPVVTVPEVSAGELTFGSTLTWRSPTQCRVLVTGSAYGVTRRIQMDLNMTVKRSGAFDYGMASRGPISVSGNSHFVGVNSPGEASMLSTTTDNPIAISVNGNTVISGDLSVSAGDASIQITGSPTVGNTSDPNLIPQHCHFGVEPPDFPVYDTSVLAPLATTIVDSSTNLNKLSSISNIRIKAGTNPTFTNKMVVNGIVYVEAPNNVRFEGQATVNGLIVTEDATSNNQNCQISFAGGVDAYGVEALPNLPQYAAVKQQAGTFILAPGFSVSFAGHVSATNGTIAADQLTFTGTAEGTVHGSLIGLKDLPSFINGTVDIYVDRTNAVQNPAGFVTTYALTADPDTYLEVLPGG